MNTTNHLFTSSLVGLIVIMVCCLSQQHVNGSLWRRIGRAADASTKVKVGVFFESKCPDSRNFFLDQLIPVYMNQSSGMNLQLVPFGKARVVAKDRMICQHGRLECQGNRFMACVLARSDNQTANLLTIGCMFDWNKSEQDCVDEFLPKSVDYKDLQRCSTSEESMRFMQENEKLTGRITYVPRIEINDKSEPECEQDLARCVQEASRSS